MTRYHLSLTFFFVFLFACAQIEKPQKSEWETIISQLNEHSTSPLKNDHHKDLFKTHKDDLLAIRKVWESKKIDNKSRKYNEQKNVFFKNSISDKNNEEFKTLQNTKPSDRKSIDSALMQSVLNDASNYHFINKDNTSNTAELEIGFCFYKALMVHYFLLQRGVPPESIKKVFAIGPLKHEPLIWKFHVAILVQSQDQLWVIDPLVKKLTLLEDWTKELQAYSAEHPYPRLRFYVTSPQKFLPNSDNYGLELINHEKIKNYNSDFLNYLKKKASSKNELAF